jgi:hypothetical protein
MDRIAPCNVVAPTYFPKAECVFVEPRDGIGLYVTSPQADAEPSGIAYHLMRPPVITMYVRRGESKKTRVVSLHPIPEKIPADELLKIGFAIDGDRASLPVDAGTYVRGQWADGSRGPHIDRFIPGVGTLPGEWAISWTLPSALRDVQMALVKWMKHLGYEVKFA